MDYIFTVLIIILAIVFLRHKKNIKKSEEEIRKEKYLNFFIIFSLLIFTMVMMVFANRGSMNIRSSMLSDNQESVESEGERERESVEDVENNEIKNEGISGRPVEPAYLYEVEQVMVILINQERVREGLNNLTLDPRLTNLARVKAWEMVELDYYEHESPSYGTMEEMVKNAGYTEYSFVGENFTRTRGSARDAVNSIRNSSRQEDHHLKEGYTHVGVGVVEVSREGFNPYRVFVMIYAGL